MRLPAQHNCPHCQQPTAWAGNPDRPFCSERCRLIDLGAWIEESYRLPANATEDVMKEFEENK